MKKVTILLSVFALVMGLSQCKKPNLPVLNIGETQHVVLNASWDNGGSKIVRDGTGLKWEKGDKLYVNQGEKSIGTLICKDPDDGTFEGYIIKVDGNITFTFGSKAYDETFFMGQSGELNDAVMLSGTSEYKVDCKYDVKMEMPHAVLKLDLSAFADDTKKDGVTVTIKAGGETVASVEGVKTDSENVYVAVKVEEDDDETPVEKPYKFSGNGKVASCKGWELKANTFYTEKGEDAPTGNAIEIVAVPAAKFTVGMDGDTPITVEFAPGNLYYNGADNDNKMNPNLPSGWNFYGHQWDCYLSGTSSVTASMEISLFTWGYGSWSTVYNTTSYQTGEGVTMDDWGSLAIGSDPAGTWRTLSSAEWAYLFNTRTVNGGTGEGKSYRRATINSDASDGSKVYGMLLYPDGYTAQTTATSYTKADWSAMESAGVVFLPAAGGRNGSESYYVGSDGYYWSSTCHYSDYAYFLYFDSGNVNPQNDGSRSNGISVRLVR